MHFVKYKQVDFRSKPEAAQDSRVFLCFTERVSDIVTIQYVYCKWESWRQSRNPGGEAGIQVWELGKLVTQR